MTERTFRRYTNLASALHILRNGCLTLLSPETWEDRNDAYFMSEYKRLKKAKSILAICLAIREETYHHWQVFSRGADGVCLEFDPEKLRLAFDRAAGVRHQEVAYRLITEVNKMEDIDLEVLPFMKRWPYGDEQEYRAIFVDQRKELDAFPVPIGRDAITRITLSPWLAPALVTVVKDTLKALPHCLKEVYRSTLLEHDQWKKLTGRVAPPIAPYGS